LRRAEIIATATSTRDSAKPEYTETHAVAKDDLQPRMGKMLSTTLITLASFFALLWIQDLALLWSAITTAPADSLQGAAPDISILIPCFNEEKVLEATILSILQSRHVGLSNVICIDDGSTDGTLALMYKLRGLYGPSLRILSGENRGKSIALNKGLSEVDTAIFVCIDADTQVLPTTLSSLSRTMISWQAGAVSGHMLAGSGEHPHWIYHAQKAEYEAANNVERRALSRWGFMTVVPGAIGAFSTDAVRGLGGFSSQTMAEDCDLTLQLLMAGYRIFHQPEAVALTEVPDTLGQLFRQRLRWATGKLQVAIRLAGPSLRHRMRVRGIWAYMTLNQCIAPLIWLPAYLTFIVCLITASFTADVSNTVLSTTMATLLVSTLTTIWGHFHARRRDSIHGSGKLQRQGSTAGIAGRLVLAAIVCAAAWGGLGRIVMRRAHVWGQITRRGDVRLPNS
jgi:cellulose synthase/poly-beta-1,6-N-acetylglucosamine synthase-like glycosyltransferase